MPKRLLDCCASDFRSFTKSDLLESIQKSEGRVIACETIGTVQPLLGNVTNAEFAASMGADILLLNMFDVQHPVINGLPEDYRAVIILSELEDLPDSEIAEILGVSLQTVKIRLHRARARLRQALNMVQHAGMPVAQVASIFALRDQIDQTRRELDHLVGQLWAELDSAMPTPSGRVFTTGADGRVWVGRHRPGARRRLGR